MGVSIKIICSGIIVISNSKAQAKVKFVIGIEIHLLKSGISFSRKSVRFHFSGYPDTERIFQCTKNKQRKDKRGCKYSYRTEQLNTKIGLCRKNTYSKRTPDSTHTLDRYGANGIVNF